MKNIHLPVFIGGGLVAGWWLYGRYQQAHATPFLGALPIPPPPSQGAPQAASFIGSNAIMASPASSQR